MAKPRILIVDDSTFTRTILRKIFESNGYEVVAEAENGKTGINMFSHYLPDVVTMDISMPDMTGLEALYKIMKIKPDAKVVMLSARGQKHSVVEAIKNGAKSFIVKPPIKEVILDVIKKVLEEKSPTTILPTDDDSSSKSTSNDITNSISYSKIIGVLCDKYEMEPYEAKKFFEKFVGEIPSMKKGLSDAFQQKDFKILEELTHKIKGSVANFQLHSVTFTASELEKFAAKKDASSCEPVMQKLFDFLNLIQTLEE